MKITRIKMVSGSFVFDYELGYPENDPVVEIKNYCVTCGDMTEYHVKFESGNVIELIGGVFVVSKEP